MLLGDDAITSLAGWQNLPFGNGYSVPSNAAPTEGGPPPPPPGTAHQAEMAGFLAGVGDRFNNQLTGDVGYASPALSMVVEGNQGQRPRQRKPRARAPAPQEWEYHKNNIEWWYMHKNLTLAATMVKMTTIHQFIATDKMYKDKFKQWKWSKNMTKNIAARMTDFNPRRPLLGLNIGNLKWPIERIKNMKSLGRASGEGGSSIQEDCPTLDGSTYETATFSGITDNDSNFGNLHGTDGACADTTEDLCRSLDEGQCRINLTSEIHSRVQEVTKAFDEVTCNYEEAESTLKDALSCYNYHLSPVHPKTQEAGHMLASLFVKTRRIGDANCILDWMTNKHGGTTSCSSKIVAHVLRVIAFLRRTRRDGEADLFTLRLLKNHRGPEARHFLLQNSFIRCIRSNERIEDLLAQSEPDELTTMFNILKDLSKDPNNHALLQDLLSHYIRKCDQLRLEHLAICSRCILATILAESHQLERALHTAEESEQLLKHQPSMEPSTFELTKRVAFTFFEIDIEACFRVLGSVLQNMDVEKFNDSRSGYRISVCEFLISTASEFHNRRECDQSRAWMNQVYSRFDILFGDNHEFTRQVKETMETCDMDRLMSGLLRMKLDD
ncbi:hypothetical protein CI102_9811 [Trichoderma harzianum]|uniref:Clr5 domain-containing protein n=1 Tax=Trichoderma harzianum CBS 226.95 TaxID=983964 RepID=A0A2T4A9W2_TRIHA|nr:hypothetical protein M431DRAFT_88023 [Trichoderma harzianum CBS 226.95]PKK45422.1 hypothetical protein CI102_9811 [Trichoderma harzianum]PTB53783.1 hypothetical protein M431DRAFT_88023 [Trichoderma harzianum CBS 226.95]